MTEENNGYVVFKRNIHGLAVKKVGKEGGRYSPSPPPSFYSRLLDK
jgi:hypothetical protein